MSRSLITRIATTVAHRLRQNHLILASSYSSSSSSAAVVSDSASSAQTGSDSVDITDNCVRRMKELQASEAADKMLRLSVEGGGCSGFQYAFQLEDKTNDDDRVFEKDGVKLVIDNISYDFVKGATVDYVEELIRSAFQVTTNPSAVGGCSCKSSFMVK